MPEMRRLGEVSEVADVAYAFFVDGMALTVRRWTEHGVDEPCARVWLADPDAVDPLAWIERVLTTGLQELLSDAGAADLFGASTRRQLAEVLPVALLAVRTCLVTGDA
jgi:hypothetical protein